MLPPASRRGHAWVHMSVCDLPVRVDVSITPGCCWCSLLLFEVSAAAGCLAFWFCDSGAEKNILTLSLNADMVDTCHVFFIYLFIFYFKGTMHKGSITVSSACPFFLTLRGIKVVSARG